jgi:LPS sulfotransferase NodH
MSIRLWIYNIEYLQTRTRNGSILFGEIYHEAFEGPARESSRRPALFIVFGNQRTGSTLVASKLNSHSRIICYEEVFLPWVDSDPSLRDWLDTTGRPQWLRAMPGVRTSFLNTLFDINNFPNDVSAIGFKVMYNQMSLWPTFAYLVPRAGQLLQDRVLRRWLNVNQVVILHTLRRNRLKVLISHELAGQSGRFHSREPAAGNHKVVLPLRGLKARLRRIEAAERVARNAILGLPTIEIFYEDYIGAGGVDEDARLCAALGETIPEGGLSSPLNKISSDDLRDTVANYDQVAAYLSGTRFERFLT